MDAKEAYLEWKKQFKVNMMVHTDEQMFELGYNYRNDYIKELEELVKDLAKVKLPMKQHPKFKCKLCKTTVRATMHGGLIWCECGSIGVDDIGEGKYRMIGDPKNFVEVKNVKAKD